LEKKYKPRIKNVVFLPDDAINDTNDDHDVLHFVDNEIDIEDANEIGNGNW